MIDKTLQYHLESEIGNIEANSSGNIALEYAHDGYRYFLDFDYMYSIDGYNDNDYFTGTGTFIKTSEALYLSSVKFSRMDEDDNEEDLPINESELEKFIIKQL